MKFMTDFSKMVFTGLLMTAFLSMPLGAEARSIDVEVQNFPEVQVTEDLHHPAKQPYYWDDTRYTSIDTMTGLYTGVSTDPVAEGKKLVVQFISFSASSRGFDNVPTIQVDIIQEDDRGFHRFIMTHMLSPQKHGNASDQLKYIVSQPMDLVLEEGQWVQIAIAARVDDSINIKGGVSGYLIDAE